MRTKKIYLLAQDLEYLEKKTCLFLCDVSIDDVLGGQVPYILESEHLKILEKTQAENEQLKKFALCIITKHPTLFDIMDIPQSDKDSIRRICNVSKEF